MSLRHMLILIAACIALRLLWRLAQRIGRLLVVHNGPRYVTGSCAPRAAIIFVAMVAVCLPLVFGIGHVLRPAKVAELAPTTRQRLIFLGAARCIPCQQMAHVREVLRTKYGEYLLIEYYDVSMEPEAGHRFGIRTIPTTIFVAPTGLELRRRYGYLSEMDIINQWRELGFALHKENAHAKQE